MTTIGYVDTFRPLAPRLRITARGRAVLLALVATPLVIAALIFGLNTGGAVATQQPATDTFTYVTVESGQSLWDIAADVAPAADPREFVADVVSLNQLESAELQPGQQLAIPHQYEG
jgi:LysM repeat protein